MKIVNAALKFGSAVRNSLPAVGTGLVSFAVATAANADALADVAAAADFSSVETNMGVVALSIAGVLIVGAGIAWLLGMIGSRR